MTNNPNSPVTSKAGKAMKVVSLGLKLASIFLDSKLKKGAGNAAKRV